MNELLEKIYNDKEFINVIDDMINNKTVQEMKKYRQHYETSCFDHCLEASYFCYKICKKLHLDYISCARAAMVHDLFLYDWRVRQPGRKGLHAFTHPKYAYENASKIFDLNKKQKNIIVKHMWPVTFLICWASGYRIPCWAITRTAVARASWWLPAVISRRTENG